jgi:hypothetical protein
MIIQTVAVITKLERERRETGTVKGNADEMYSFPSLNPNLKFLLYFCIISYLRDSKHDVN